MVQETRVSAMPNAEVFLRGLEYARKEILASVTALLQSKKKICGGHAFF